MASSACLMRLDSSVVRAEREKGMPASLMRIVDHSVSLKWLTL